MGLISEGLNERQFQWGMIGTDRGTSGMTNSGSTSSAVSGTSSEVGPSATAIRHHVVTTGSTIGNDAWIGGASTSDSICWSERDIYFRAFVVVSDTTQLRWFCGLTNTTNGNNIDEDTPDQEYIGFRLSPGATAGNWFMTTDDASQSPTSTDTGVTANAGNYVLEFLYDHSAGEVEFWIDGTLEGTITTTLPSDAILAPFCGVETKEAAAKSIGVNHIYFEAANP